MSCEADPFPLISPSVSLMESCRWVHAKESGSLRTQGPGRETAPQSMWSLGSQVPCVPSRVSHEAVLHHTRHSPPGVDTCTLYSLFRHFLQAFTCRLIRETCPVNLPKCHALITCELPYLYFAAEGFLLPNVLSMYMCFYLLLFPFPTRR